MRAFPELLIEQNGDEVYTCVKDLKLPVRRGVGSLNPGVYMQKAVQVFTQGDIKEAGISQSFGLSYSSNSQDMGKEGSRLYRPDKKRTCSLKCVGTLK